MKALIFDVDGTLADTEDAHREAFNDAFAAAGYDWHWDRALYKKLLAVTGGQQRIRFFLESHDPAFLQRDDIDDIVPALHKAKTASFVGRLQQGQVPLRPGIEDLITAARAQNLTIAIATTTTPINVTTLLTANLGEASIDWFACIGDGGKVPNLKPEPDVYNWVVDQLGLDPSDTLALEDSRNGLVSCERAAVPCLIVTNDYTEGQDFSGALDILDTYEGLTIEALSAIHGRFKGGI